MFCLIPNNLNFHFFHLKVEGDGIESRLFFKIFSTLNEKSIYPRGSRSRLVHGPAQITTALEVRALPESKNIFVLSPKGTTFSTKQLSMIVPPEF